MNLVSAWKEIIRSQYSPPMTQKRLTWTATHTKEEETSSQKKAYPAHFYIPGAEAAASKNSHQPCHCAKFFSLDAIQAINNLKKFDPTRPRIENQAIKFLHNQSVTLKEAYRGVKKHKKGMCFAHLKHIASALNMVLDVTSTILLLRLVKASKFATTRPAWYEGNARNPHRAH